MKRFRFSVAVVCEYPHLFLIASTLLALFFIAFIPSVKTVDNVDYFTVEDDPDIEFYDRFKKVFGNDEFFVVAFEKEKIFTESNLSLLKNITEDLEAIDDIRELRSLGNIDDTVGDKDYFEVAKFLESIPENTSELEELRQQAIKNPLYVKNLISPDARTAAILVSTFDRPHDENYRKKLLTTCRKVLDRYQNAVDRFYLAGWTTTNLSLGLYMQKDIATFIPITYILVTLTILLFFGSMRLTLLALGNISVCVGSTMGLFGVTGITLNNATTIIPPLVMALALCDTVHIFSHMDKRVLAEISDNRKALASVLKKVVMPCFMTTLTTAIGFLSLAVSEIPPIREFAWIASVGMVFEFIYSFFFLPPLILLCAPEKIYKDYESKGSMTFFLTKISNLVQKRYKLIVALSCALILSSCWFASKIRVETNLLEYFKKSSPVRTALAFVETRLSGVGTLDISLRAREEDDFKQPRNLQVVETIQQYLKSLREVNVTISFIDFIKDMNQSFHDENPHHYRIPETMEMVSQYLLLYDSDDIEDFINSTYDHARIAVRVSEHSSAGLAKLIREIERFIKSIDNRGLEIRVTGRAVHSVNTIDALVKGQVYSLSIAIAVISIIMIFVLRSFAIGLLSLIPNLFPIIFNFGIMGVAGIPLNTATALIAAVALGIAVDDTIHFLSEYKILRAQGISIPNSLKVVTLIKGRAILSSSLILCTGLGVLVSSNFGPTMNFGMLSAIIMLTAVIGDLIVLPSIIMLRKSEP